MLSALAGHSVPLMPIMGELKGLNRACPPANIRAEQAAPEQSPGGPVSTMALQWIGFQAPARGAFWR